MPTRPTASFSIPSIVVPSGRGRLAYFFPARVDSKRLPVKEELVRSVVSSHIHQQPVRPVHGDLHRVKDMQRLAARRRIDADRLRLERELLGAQGGKF